MNFSSFNRRFRTPFPHIDLRAKMYPGVFPPFLSLDPRCPLPRCIFGGIARASISVPPPVGHKIQLVSCFSRFPIFFLHDSTLFPDCKSRLNEHERAALQLCGGDLISLFALFFSFRKLLTAVSNVFSFLPFLASSDLNP